MNKSLNGARAEIETLDSLLQAPQTVTTIATEKGLATATVGSNFARLLRENSIVPCDAPEEVKARRDSKWHELTDEGRERALARIIGIAQEAGEIATRATELSQNR